MTRVFLLLAACLVFSSPAYAQLETCEAAFPSASWTITVGGFADNGAGLCNGTGATWNMGWWNAASFNADQYAEVTVSSTNIGSGVCVRMSGTSDATKTGYCMIGDPNTSFIEVREFNSGGGVSFLVDDYAATWTNGSVFRIEISGSNITTKIDGVTKWTGSDVTLTTGSPGMIFVNINARSDNFNAGNLSTCTPGTLALLGAGC